MSEPRPSRARRDGNVITRPFRRTAADIRDPQRSRWQRAGIAFAVLFTWLMIIPAVFMIFVLLLIPTAPSAEELRRQTALQPSVLLASDGTEIAQLESQNRLRIPLDSVSSHFIDALLAVEDHRFLSHHGIDWRRTARAGLRTVGGRMEGGSTITQQLARNLYPDDIGRTLTVRRKLKEMITARRIERTNSKDQILYAYINSVPFLYNAFGVEMAARTYFDKSAADLDILESATLVGMLKGTSYYNPVRHPDRSQSRRNLVLRQMAERGILDHAEVDSLREEPLDLNFQRQEGPTSDYPHFTRYVRDWLSDWADRNNYDLFTDGLVIHTTLDRQLQRYAEAAVRQRGDQLENAARGEWSDGSGTPMGAFWSRNPQLADRALQRTAYVRELVDQGMSAEAALDSVRSNPSLRDSLMGLAGRLEVGFVAMQPRTGHIKAWVGSRDFKLAPFDHVAQAKRQPGSVFKPFVYAAALQRGYQPGDTFVDEQLPLDVGYGRVWRPANAGGHHTGLPTTLTEGLAYSKNTVTAQLMMEVGPTNVAGIAREMGIRESSLDPVPSLALGTSDVSLLEMTTAYGTFASGGQYNPPVPVTRIESSDGRVLAEFGSRGERALSPDVAQVVVHMLRGAIDRGTGRRIRTEFGITKDVAGKTGTSQHGADGWFLLMHPDLVAGSWVGFAEPTIRFRTSQWAQGGRNALLVVGDFFRDASGSLSDARFETPARYRDPDSIWEPTRQWWAEGDYDTTGVYPDSLYLADWSEWEPGDDPFAGLDDEVDDLPDFDGLDDPEDVDPVTLDGAEDTAASGDDAPQPTTGDDADDGRTAVQRLYDRTGEDLEADLDDDGD